MELKKSIEKAEQQRKIAQREAEEDASTDGKTGAIASKETTAPAAGAEEAIVRDTEDTCQEWAAPVYCESKAIELDLKKLAQNRIVCMFPDAPEAEYYKIVRTNIQHRAREKNWNTIMVTSVQPGEGKTLTSINLAISFAREFNQTVLLVDCDLKRQNIHRYLNISLDKGIVDYLVNDCQLKDLIVWPNIEKLTLISGGKTTTDSTELIGSPKMKALVHEIKNRYNERYVIFDAPPILGGADAIAFAPLVDCILMVVEEGRTSIQDAKKALEMIPREKILGFVLNRRTVPLQKYYY